MCILLWASKVSFKLEAHSSIPSCLRIQIFVMVQILFVLFTPIMMGFFGEHELQMVKQKAGLTNDKDH